MIFIKIDENENVIYQNNFPFDEKLGLNKTETQLLYEGYLVQSIPQPETKAGEIGVLKYDKNNNTLYYEYVDRPLTPEEKNIQLEAEITNLNATLDMLLTELIPSLLGGGEIE